MPQKRGARRSGARKRPAAPTKEKGDANGAIQVYHWGEQDPIPCCNDDEGLSTSWIPWTTGHFLGNDAPLLPSPAMGVPKEKWQILQSIWQSLKTSQSSAAVNDDHSRIFQQPTAIQLHAWPGWLAKRSSHLVLIAPTGSGKTLAYGLPMIVDALSNPHGRGIRGIVIVPTRELAVQVQSSLQRILLHCNCTPTTSSLGGTPMNIVACYGGLQVSLAEQLERLSEATFVTATPGRLLDLLPQLLSSKTEQRPQGGPFCVSSLTVVMDEADRLATHSDLSQQVSEILVLLPSVRRRCILGSATWPQRATHIWKEWWWWDKTDHDDSAPTSRTLEQDPVSPEHAPNDAIQNYCTIITVDTMALHTNHKKGSSDNTDVTNNVVEKKNAAGPSSTTELDTLEPTKRRRTARSEESILVVSKIPPHLTQVLHVCAQHKKPKKLLHTLDTLFSTARPSGIVFFETIKTLSYIHALLQKERPHIVCAPWHSQLPAAQRERVFAQFVRGSSSAAANAATWSPSVLLATDVAARGVHTAHLQFVIQYDFPSNVEQYVHRCGRVGRAPPESASSSSTSMATIYSFFTRNFAPLAPDMIALLESTHQWVDPNLRALVPPPKSQTAAVASQTQKASVTAARVDPPSMNDYDNEEDDDPFFQQLSAHRMVLTRASHVSDASESESNASGD